jgi:hypothetical protein
MSATAPTKAAPATAASTTDDALAAKRRDGSVKSGGHGTGWRG